jgi:hypothetical protein
MSVYDNIASFNKLYRKAMRVDYEMLDAQEALKKAIQALAVAISESKPAEEIAVLAEQETNLRAKVENMEVVRGLRPFPDWRLPE